MDEFVEERLEWLVNSHYNLFHSSLIIAALKSPAISDKDFILGCVQIHTAEEKDYGDEFVPKEFENLM